MISCSSSICIENNQVLLRNDKRQIDTEGAAAAELAFDADHTLVSLHDTLDDCQTQSRAHNVFGSFIFHPVEAVEDLSQVRFRDAETGVRMLIHR